jgi:ubiquinone/menaquinone biosynthesis C-methylase UbiE
LGATKTDYSKMARCYDKFRPPPTDNLLLKIIEYGKIEANSSVLDVGCGTGRFPLSLATLQGAIFCALEPSNEMLKEARTKDKTKRIAWIRGDGHHMPFRDAVFDCVYMTLVLHHIENKGQALGEMLRVLNIGGKCVIMTNSHSGIKKHIIGDFPGVLAIDLKRFPTIPSLKRMITALGFKNVHHHVVELDRGYVSTDEYLERVRKRYISTLTLLPNDEFEKGFEIFQNRVRKKCGSHMKYTHGFVFVTGEN